MIAGAIASRSPWWLRVPNRLSGYGGLHSIFSPLPWINFVLLALLPLTFSVPVAAQSGGYGAGSYSTQTYSSTLHGIPRGTEGATGLRPPVWLSRPKGLDQWRKSVPSGRALSMPGMPKAQGYTDFSGYYGSYARPRSELEAEANAAAQTAETAEAAAAAAAQQASAQAAARAAAAREADAKRRRAALKARSKAKSKDRFRPLKELRAARKAAK